MLGDVNVESLEGVVPRSVNYVFEWIKYFPPNIQISISIQTIEIYNEKLIDLINPKNDVVIT